jgi:uncharacterized membrane protein (DUF2068 family)
MSHHPHHPPGTRPPRRFRPRLHWELVICSLRGHALVGRHAAALRPQDAIFAREDAAGVRWFRCLRCDSWLPLPPPEQTMQEQHPPEREQIELPLRGKPLRDKVVLRLIAIDRAFHFVVLVALGLLVLLFAADRATLRDTFYKVITDLQGGVAASQAHTHGILHEIDNAFTTSSSHLHLVGAVLLVYGAVEGIEAVGLWYQRRWAEYLTFLVTASLLPLEIYELATRATVFKAIAFVINVAVVVYLLRAKRLFGLRGGVAAEHAEAAIDQGWEALERTAPPVAAPVAAESAAPPR